MTVTSMNEAVATRPTAHVSASTGAATSAPITAPITAPKAAHADDAERAVRQDLAAAYRLVAHHGMDDSIYTHISARVPGRHDQFLINPYGFLFRDITASSLVKIDVDGQRLDDSPYDVNPAGFTIHSAVHAARHDAVCVLHTHTVAGVAVSSLACGLQPCNQWALQFHDRVAYHDFEGIALDVDERERLVADLGPTRRALILRNHGLVTVGRSVAEAFILMLNLERACRVQIAIQSSGQAVYPVPAEVCEKTALQYEGDDGDFLPGTADPNALEWRAMLRRIEPSPPVSFAIDPDTGFWSADTPVTRVAPAGLVRVARIEAVRARCVVGDRGCRAGFGVPTDPLTSKPPTEPHGARR